MDTRAAAPWDVSSRLMYRHSHCALSQAPLLSDLGPRQCSRIGWGALSPGWFRSGASPHVFISNETHGGHSCGEWGATLVHPHPQPRRPQLHLCGEHRSFRSPLGSLPVFPSLGVKTYKRQMETWGPREAFLKVQWRHQGHFLSSGLSCNTGTWLTLFSAPPNHLSSGPRCTSLLAGPWK